MSKSHPTRVCTICGVERRLIWYARNQPDPYVCKYCKPKKLDADRWKMDPEYRRKWNLARRYKMDIDEYDRLFEQQGGVCAICKSPPNSHRLAVDHDHGTGAVRGLLCPHCNSSLAWLEMFEATAHQYLGC